MKLLENDRGGFAATIRWVSPISLLFLTACSSLVSHAQPIGWTLPSLTRIGPSSSAGTSTTATIYAAKGESESFQIAVRAPGSGLSNVSVAAPDLVGPGGAVIARSNITMYREHFVYISQPQLVWGTNLSIGTGWYPDPLIPFVNPQTGAPLAGAALDAVPFSLSANSNQIIWVDVNVPRTAVGGTYTGTFSITSLQGNTSVSVSLRVWNFEIPVKPALKSTFQYWGGTDSLATLQSATSKAVWEEMLKHRLATSSMAYWHEREFVDRYGLRTNGLTNWSGADASNCSMSPPPSVATIQSIVSLHQGDVSLYAHSADEIGHCANLDEPVKWWARNLHAAGVKNLITMTPKATLFDDGSGQGRPAVDIWVVLPKQYDASTSLVQQAQALGSEVWSYNTLMQDEYSPKWQIDFDPINFRIQPGFINQSLGLTGLSYWKIDHWTADPWNNIQNILVGVYYYRGDGILIYPGAQVGIVGAAPSMRLKWLRDGVDDYDYIDLLKQKGQGAWALAKSRTVGPDWRNWTRNSALLESVRIEMGNELERLFQTVDTLAPTLTVTSPAEGAAVSGTVLVTATATDNVGVNRMEFSIDDVYKQTVFTAPFTYSWNTAGLTPGSHRITVVVYDARWNATIVNRTVTVSNGDLQPPLLAFTSLVNGSIVTGNVNVQATASDNVAVRQVELFVDGIFKSVDFAAPYVLPWNSTGSPGNHVVTLVAYDAVWNRALVAITVNVQ